MRIQTLLEILFRIDYKNRTLLKSSITVVINTMIGVGKLFLGIFFLSDWLMVNALYYITIALAKGRVLYKYSKIKNITEVSLREREEKKLFRNNGFFQCLIGISYFAVSLHTVFVEETPDYPRYLAFIVIVISFEKIGCAIYGLFKTRQMKSPAANVLKIIDFTDAMVSIVVSRTIIQLMQNEPWGMKSAGYFGMGCSAVFIIIGLIMLFQGRKNGTRKDKK